MSWINTPEMHLLETYMDLTVTRQSLITSNIANVDTPGYKTRDIDFQGELSRAVLGNDPALTEPAVHEVGGLIARPDGNNVSVDRESLLLAQVQLEFGAAEQLLKSEFKGLDLAINGGNGGL